jgi:hypothetical protein
MRVAVATATTPPRQATPTRPARRQTVQPEPGSRALAAQYRLTAARVKAACGVAPASAPRTLTQATARPANGSYPGRGIRQARPESTPARTPQSRKPLRTRHRICKALTYRFI